VIEVRDGRLREIRFRPFPKLISGLEAGWLGRWRHGRRPGKPAGRISINRVSAPIFSR